MDVVRLGMGFRALRMRRRWTQAQLGAKAHVSRAVVCGIERGHADRVAVHTLVRVAAALDARLDIRLLWQGEGLDRLLDLRHAGLVDQVLEILSSSDWETATEVSFNVRGERGSIDILAFHAATGSLLVIEIKSVVPDMQAMLAGVDRKGRLARDLARAGLEGDISDSAAGAPRRPHGTTPSRGIRSDLPNRTSGSNGGDPPLATPTRGLDARCLVPVRCAPAGHSSSSRDGPNLKALSTQRRRARERCRIQPNDHLTSIWQESTDECPPEALLSEIRMRDRHVAARGQIHNGPTPLPGAPADPHGRPPGGESERPAVSRGPSQISEGPGGLDLLEFALDGFLVGRGTLARSTLATVSAAPLGRSVPGLPGR
jgi:transcriptional regulator with XRE-family HTH domain